MSAQRFGPTGRFPRGKLSKSDEGGLVFGVTAKKGSVIVNFGSPVAWFGLSPVDARKLADALKKKADEAEVS